MLSLSTLAELNLGIDFLRSATKYATPRYTLSPKHTKSKEPENDPFLNPIHIRESPINYRTLHDFANTALQDHLSHNDPH